jgi:hypothetical protein
LQLVNIFPLKSKPFEVQKALIKGIDNFAFATYTR